MGLTVRLEDGGMFKDLSLVYKKNLFKNRPVPSTTLKHAASKHQNLELYFWGPLSIPHLKLNISYMD